MQGDFDSELKWPFTGRMVFTLFDQNEEEPHHITLAWRPGLKPNFKRHLFEYGYTAMIPHPTLKTRGYVKNNTMVVKVEIR